MKETELKSAAAVGNINVRNRKFVDVMMESIPPTQSAPETIVLDDIILCKEMRNAF